jgi:alkyl hydroperoxide reductase subunit AhpF
MSAGRVIGYLAAAILIFFGVLFIWSAAPGTLIVGAISISAGLILIWLAGRRSKSEKQTIEVVQKIDLSGDVSLEKMTCRNCGGALSSENIKVITGAPFVNCPYCGTSYQLEEAPKW